MKKSSVANWALSLTFLLCWGAQASKLEFAPEIGASLIYTDNAQLSEIDQDDGEIGLLNFGLASNYQGPKSAFELEYKLRQAYYSYDSDKNKLFHDLTFFAEQKLADSGFSVLANVDIDILPADVAENAITDVVSGDLIQGSNTGLTLAYASNPRSKIDLRASVDASIYRYEDDRGNNNDYSGQVSFADGLAIKNWFWLIDLDYSNRESRGNTQATESVNYRGELGWKSNYDLRPFVRYQGESYLQGDNASQQAGESEYWGAGLRYMRSRRSYLELSYNLSRDDLNDDYVGAAVNLEPNRRTRLFFEYKKRYFGHAYEFDFTHTKRRLTTNISYDEEPGSFDRYFYVEGDVVEEQKLYKRFDFTNTLSLKRSEVELNLFHQDRSTLQGENILNETNDESFGADIAIDHKLSRNLILDLGLGWERLDFDRSDYQKQEDYWRAKIGLEQTLIEDFSVSYSYQFTRRESTQLERDYDENRLSIEATKRF